MVRAKRLRLMVLRRFTISPRIEFLFDVIGI
jgi:hypothetical protein